MSADSSSSAGADSGWTGRRFENRVVLITGASDRGIGGAIAERLAREGASLALVSNTEPKRLLKRLTRLNCDHGFWLTDICDEQAVLDAVQECVARWGRFYAVVNNAGVEIARPFEEFTPDQWKEVLDVNLHGAIRVTQATLPHLQSPGGVIVNVASALALGGCPSFSIYSASKAGLVGLTQSLAWELSPRRIRVVAVAPGLVSTPMVQKHISHLNQEVWDKIEACHPLGMGLPHDVAGAVAFLASEDARWVTGVTLPLGWSSNYQLPVEHFMSG